MVQWTRVVLDNGLGRYQEALTAAREATADPLQPGAPKWGPAEPVEAGARSGEARVAAGGLEQLSAMAHARGTDWALGVEASRRALLRDTGDAEDLFREALERLARTTVQVEFARAQLLFGEWLRRRGRRIDAR